MEKKALIKEKKKGWRGIFTLKLVMNGPDWLLAFWPCVYLPLSTPSPLLLSHSVLSLDFEVVKRRGVRGAAAEEKMLLGKRPRPPMKRTTSMTEFTLDPNSVQQPPSDSQNPFKDRPKSVGFGGDPYRQPSGVDGYGFDHRFLSAVSPRNPRRYSADFVDNSHFLRACCLCKRRLVSGRDIYMYRYSITLTILFLFQNLPFQIIFSGAEFSWAVRR